MKDTLYIAYKAKYSYPATKNVYWSQILEGPMTAELVVTRYDELKKIKGVKEIMVLEKHMGISWFSRKIRNQR